MADAAPGLPVTASALDGTLGLTLVEAAGGHAVLRLDPPALAVSDGALHGGAVATCVDTAAWYAAASASEGATWVVASITVDFVRPAGQVPHRVDARVRRLGRTVAVADVELAPWDEPERLVALGRARLACR